jgi:hypothetical protein
MIAKFSMLVFIVLAACSKSNVPVQQPAVENLPAVMGRQVHVSTAAALKAALLDAKPGDVILMADAVYKGKFVVTANMNGTVQHPITLTGSRNAILDAESIHTGYVLHLQASHWKLKGFTITNGLKGLVADGVSNSIIDSINVHTIGEEGIHLRMFSSKNIIRHVSISHVGLKTPDYGEGIYIGSAKSNWATYTNGAADKCDSNSIINNIIGPGITAECIDVKEGTTAGVIKGNYFDATGITGANSADSWIDVKGNYTLIEDNTGFNPGGSIFKDGYQVHVAVQGWGNFNEFKNNNSTVNAAGFGFNIQLSGSNGTTTGNKVYNNNTVSGAAAGIANITLSN